MKRQVKIYRYDTTIYDFTINGLKFSTVERFPTLRQLIDIGRRWSLDIEWELYRDVYQHIEVSLFRNGKKATQGSIFNLDMESEEIDIKVEKVTYIPNEPPIKMETGNASRD